MRMLGAGCAGAGWAVWNSGPPFQVWCSLGCPLDSLPSTCLRVLGLEQCSLQMGAGPSLLVPQLQPCCLLQWCHSGELGVKGTLEQEGPGTRVCGLQRCCALGSQAKGGQSCWSPPVIQGAELCTGTRRAVSSEVWTGSGRARAQALLGGSCAVSASLLKPVCGSALLVSSLGQVCPLFFPFLQVSPVVSLPHRGVGSPHRWS